MDVQSPLTQSLIFLAIAALVVFRFARRELTERRVRSPLLWLRPAVLVLVTVYLVVITTRFAPAQHAMTVASLVLGVLLGLLTGGLIVRYTTFRSAGVPNAVLARGSRITFAIWLGAFVLRLLARLLVPHGSDRLAQLPLNCGTVALVTAAFVVIAVAFQRAIGRYASGPPGLA